MKYCWKFCPTLARKKDLTIQWLTRDGFKTSTPKLKIFKLEGLLPPMKTWKNCKNLSIDFQDSEVSLDSRLDNYLEILPLKSLNLKGKSIKFDVTGDLIKTKNRRIKQEDFEDFTHFEYKPYQIIYFEVYEHFGFVKEPEEENMSLNSLRRISTVFIHRDVISKQCLEAILTRPALEQIDIHFNTGLDFDIEQEFPKNYTVEEITFKLVGREIVNLEKWKKLFDALPNIKRVRVVKGLDYIYNFHVFIKILSVFKNLESLHFAITNFDVQCNINLMC